MVSENINNSLVILNDLLASRFDCWMFLGQRAFNPTDKLYTNHGGRVISVDELSSLSDTHGVHEKMFEFQKKLQKLKMNEEENCTLAAMSVMSTGLWFHTFCNYCYWQLFLVIVDNRFFAVISVSIVSTDKVCGNQQVHCCHAVDDKQCTFTLS